MVSARTGIFLSGAFWTGIFLYSENVTAAAVMGMGHILFFALHRIEGKLNRLLSHHRIYMLGDDE